MGLTNELEIRAAKVAECFLSSELNDYSCYSYKVTEVESCEQECTVRFRIKENDKEIHWGRFRITFDENWETDAFDEDNFENGCTIEINIFEDLYEKVEVFDWTVKYFWIAILQDNC